MRLEIYSIVLGNCLNEIIMSKILLIQVLDYQDTPPSIAARFWWSEESGVTCDDSQLFRQLEKEGVVIPGPKTVYPSAGRAFFDALRFRFSGLVRAQEPVTVDQKGGI